MLAPLRTKINVYFRLSMFLRQYISKIGIAVGIAAFVVGIAAVLVFNPAYRVWFAAAPFTKRPFGLDPNKMYIPADSLIMEVDEYNRLHQEAEARKAFEDSHVTGRCEAIRPEDGAYPWARQQVEEREFFRAFQKTVAADDRKRVVSMMRYPLEIIFDNGLDAETYDSVYSPRELFRAYDTIFCPETKNAIAGVDPNKLKGERFFPNTRFGRVEIFVDDLNDYPDCNFAIKIKRITTFIDQNKLDRGDIVILHW